MAIDWLSKRDGFDHRRGKPTARPINWKYWGSLQDWTQWDAFALSLNLNPENLEKSPHSWMSGPGRGPMFLGESFPSQAVEIEFDRRLTMFGRVIGGRPLATVSPAQFAAWCLHVGLENLPSELVAMAAKEPKAEPEPQAAPVVESVVRAPVKSRRNLLTPVIESAQRECGNATDAPAIWAALARMAEARKAPLLGVSDGGIRWQDPDDNVKFFTLKNLRDRLQKGGKKEAVRRGKAR